MPNEQREIPSGENSRYASAQGARPILLSLLPAASIVFLAIGTAQAQGNTASQAPTAQTASTAAEAAAAQQQEQQRVISTDPTLARVGGVLTPRGMFALEPSYEYFYAQNTQAIVNGFTIIPGITFGTVDIRQSTQRGNLGAVTLRYGVTDRMEVNLRVPWLSQSDTIQTAPADTNAQPITIGPTGSGLGDIEFGTSYQINDGLNDWPVFIANLRVKSDSGRSPFDVPIYTINDPQGGFTRGLPKELPTGTGFWAIDPGLTVAWASDPAVFFGSLRYIWNIARDVDIQDSAGGAPTRTNLDPGDGVGINFGVGFSLNEKSSISISYEHVRISASRSDGRKITGSDYDTGTFNFGLSYRVSDRMSVNLGVGIGVTDQTPDTRVILRVPIRFSL
jgi:opacity protein-like surface antigen